MFYYCLKCKKKKKKILTVLIQKSLQLVMVEQWYYQNVPCVAVKNQHCFECNSVECNSIECNSTEL